MGGEINIPDEQFGRKLGKHAASFGLDPSRSDHRTRLHDTIKRIGVSPDRVVEGRFRGRGAVKFFIKGEDVVVTSLSNDFVTILKGGIINPSVRRALSDD